MESEQHHALEKVRKLLALAESENENEASTAALAAVRIIKKYELRIIVPKQIKPDGAALEDLLNGFVRSPGRAQPVDPGTNVRISLRDILKKMVTETHATRTSCCRKCLGIINIGDPVLIKADVGSWHPHCF